MNRSAVVADLRPERQNLIQEVALFEGRFRLPEMRASAIQAGRRHEALLRKLNLPD